MNQTNFIPSVKQILDENHVRYDTEENEKGTKFIMFPLRGSNSVYDCFFALNERDNWIIFKSNIPNKIEDKRRREIAEYLIRLNELVMDGNFGMHYSTGGLFFETNLNLKFIPEIRKEDITDLISSHVYLLDFALNGLYRIIFGNLNPEQAIDSLNEAK